MAAQVVVPDKGFATPFMVTNKWSLAGRKGKKKVSILPTLVTLVLFKGLKCLVGKAMGSVSTDGFH